jgi:NDP-sugar pyrophosphorylase family protein
MAGLGNRFKIEGYNDIKPMIKIGGQTMIERVVSSLGLDGQYIFVLNNKNTQSNELKTLLRNITNDPIIIEIDYLTDGPASTALLCKEYINNDTPLIVTNCDQIMEWDTEHFKNHIENTNTDATVVTYTTTTPKNSYVEINDGEVIKFYEKQVIGDVSLNGIHFWKKGRYFVNSAESMINKNIRVNNEFYVSLTYNEMIEQNQTIDVYHIQNNNHWSVGTPSDLEKYLEHANL